jgi:transcription antitermination factor NusG
MPSCSPEWYALAVKPQHERVAARGLENLGMEPFLPLYRARRRWSDRFKDLELPLFGGYVFCHFSPPGRWQALRAPGVVAVVGFGGRPAPVSEAEIAALRRAAASGAPVEPWPFLNCGQPVRVERGPLAGVEGLLVRVKDNWRVVLSVELLQRSVAVEVDRDAVMPAPAPRRSVLPCRPAEQQSRSHGSLSPVAARSRDACAAAIGGAENVAGRQEIGP